MNSLLSVVESVIAMMPVPERGVPRDRRLIRPAPLFSLATWLSPTYRQRPRSELSWCVFACIVVGCNVEASEVDASRPDASGADALVSDANLADTGPQRVPRIAVAHFASTSELQMVDVCAVPAGGGAPIRIGARLGISALARMTVTNPMELPSGFYTFTAISAGATDCTDAIRGFSLSIGEGDDWMLLVAGGTGPGEATPVLGRIGRSARIDRDHARIRTVQLAVDTATGIGGHATDLSLDFGATERMLGMGASFGRTGSDPEGDALGYVAVTPATNVQIVVRSSGMPEELGRSSAYAIEGGHVYTAYVYGYAFMGGATIEYLVCDDSTAGADGRAACL